MAKYKSHNYSQNVLIPVSLEDQLMLGILEFAIHTLVETRREKMDCGANGEVILRTMSPLRSQNPKIGDPVSLRMGLKGGTPSNDSRRE